MSIIEFFFDLEPLEQPAAPIPQHCHGVLLPLLSISAQFVTSLVSHRFAITPPTLNQEFLISLSSLSPSLRRRRCCSPTSQPERSRFLNLARLDVTSILFGAFRVSDG